MTKTATNQNTKAQKETKAQDEQKQIVKLDEQLQQIVDKMLASNNKLICYAVSGYDTFKLGNKVLCELHFKKRSISHVTFNNNIVEIDNIIKQNNLLYKLGDKTWTLRAECLVTNELLKHFETIVKIAIEKAQPKVEPKQNETKAKTKTK